MVIVFLSVLGIALEEMKSDLMPINPTIMRVMRVLRIARGKIQRLVSPNDLVDPTNFHIFVVLKLLKMAKGIRALLDTVMQALPQVGNLGLLFFLLFFIFAALGVEMFGRLGKTRLFPQTFLIKLKLPSFLKRIICNEKFKFKYELSMRKDNVWIWEKGYL